MESVVRLIDKLKIDNSLIKFCRNQLLTVEDVVSLKSKLDWRIKLKINIEYDLSYDKLYLGPWSQVPEEHRRMFQVLSFLKSYCIVVDLTNQTLENLLNALHVLDIGIIVETGSEESDLLSVFAQQLHEIMVANHPPATLMPIKLDKTSTSSDLCDIDINDRPSDEEFWTKYFYIHRPVKLTNCIKHWPAMSKWNDLNYFMKSAGYRTVPVELGKKYDHDDWSQGMFRLGEFLEEFMSAGSSRNSSGYLAQHDLFDQIPQLRNDFSIPDYCAIGTREPVIKSWIGPANTISTMHTDDKHNMLCQVMGEKLIILASPSDIQNLYCYDGLLNNTCQIDPENLDFNKFPLTKNVKFFKLTLRAGEILYLPKLWFHYVRSLTSSISVSFWFDVNDDF